MIPKKLIEKIDHLKKDLNYEKLVNEAHPLSKKKVQQ